MVAISLAVAIGMSAACARTAEQPALSREDGFRRVVAQVRGITWPACAATMEVALRRRLAGVADVSISQAEQKAAVTFLPGTRVFSAAEFRGAVAEADVDVVSFEVEVCGVVDGEDTISAAIDVSPRLRINGADRDPSARVCVVGRLDESVIPYAVHVAVGRPSG